MRLTTHTDYSLRILIYLALAPQRLATIREISERYGISRNHLMKIVRKLGQAGYVETVRGKHGGIRLGDRPENITVGDVVRTMEDNMNVVECFNSDSSGCLIVPACVLKGVLFDALEQFLCALDRHALADLIVPKNDLSALVGLTLEPA